MGEAFRAAFGIAPSQTWQAQKDLSDLAKATASKSGTAKMQAARDALVRGYRTMGMPQAGAH